MRTRGRKARLGWGMAIGAATAILLGATGAQAVPLTLNFSGTINRAPGAGGDWGVKVGDPFQGTYSFDASSEDLRDSAAQGWYRFTEPGAGMTVAINGSTFAAAGALSRSGATVLNDRPALGDAQRDLLFFQTAGRDLGPEVERGVVPIVRVWFTDRFTSGTGALADDSLPTSLDLDDFTWAVFQFGLRDTRSGAYTPQFWGRVRAASIADVSIPPAPTLSESPLAEGPTPVPEPGTMFLLGTGLIGLAAFGRRRLGQSRGSLPS